MVWTVLRPVGVDNFHFLVLYVDGITRKKLNFMVVVGSSPKTFKNV